MRAPARVLRAQSSAADARDAVREFHAGVDQPDLALVVFFCSVDYDLAAIASEMNRLFRGVQVVGCTTAGEIGPAGYRDGSLVGASFPAGQFTATTGSLDELHSFELTQASDLVLGLRHRLELAAPQAGSTNTFALLLIDGLSVREEPVTQALQSALGGVPLVGGSAGDGLKFCVTHVFAEGEFRSGCAVLTLVTTPLPFRTFKTQHFVPTDNRVVVTSADADRRIIKQINGRPAADEYARLVSATVGSLDPLRFAGQPVVVMLGGTSYVRSIQKANPDGSLTLYCAIEEGVVLRTARGVDLVENLTQTFDRITADIGRPQVVIGVDCVLRKLEINQSGLTGQVEDTLGDNHFVGFNSYGEQFGGTHVNQTFTGIAIAEPSRLRSGTSPAR
jgi:hypothetical protein